MRGETCPWDHGIDPVVLEDINNPALISIQGAPHIRGGISKNFKFNLNFLISLNMFFCFPIVFR